MTIRHGNFIGGTWQKSGGACPNINPSDISDVVGEYASASATDVAEAAAAARDAFATWSESSPQVRFDILDAAGSQVLARRTELAELLAREEGKPVGEASGEVHRAGSLLKFFAGEALRTTGDMVSSLRPGISVEVTREPVGVIGIITPWNFPIAIPAWKIAPALAFGNTVVIKPAELVPGCAWELVKVLADCGLPEGVLNLVMGTGSVAGQALVDADEVDAVTFTGSVAVGGGIIARAAQSHKRVQAEMGGKNPMVVLDDADLTTAVDACVNGAFFSTGQRCTASSRLIVSDGIHDAFVEAVLRRMKELTVGHALDPDTVIGPVVDQRQLDQDLGYLDIARHEGGTVHGGELVELPTTGFFLAPALVTGTTNDMRINQEEVFGPIASVVRVSGYEEALSTANDTQYGLSAGICSRSLAAVSHFKRHVRAGMVMVNAPTAGVDYHVPFGGSRRSSYGPREQGTYAREFFTAVKTTYVNPGRLEIS